MFATALLRLTVHCLRSLIASPIRGRSIACFVFFLQSPSLHLPKSESPRISGRHSSHRTGEHHHRDHHRGGSPGGGGTSGTAHSGLTPIRLHGKSYPATCTFSCRVSCLHADREFGVFLSLQARIPRVMAWMAPATHPSMARACDLDEYMKLMGFPGCRSWCTCDLEALADIFRCRLGNRLVVCWSIGFSEDGAESTCIVSTAGVRSWVFQYKFLEKRTKILHKKEKRADKIGSMQGFFSQ